MAAWTPLGKQPESHKLGTPTELTKNKKEKELQLVTITGGEPHLLSAVCPVNQPLEGHSVHVTVVTPCREEHPWPGRSQHPWRKMYSHPSSMLGEKHFQRLQIPYGSVHG